MKKTPRKVHVRRWPGADEAICGQPNTPDVIDDFKRATCESCRTLGPSERVQQVRAFRADGLTHKLADALMAGEAIYVDDAGRVCTDWPTP